MTIYEIDREISRLEALRKTKEKELLSDLKEYVGRYYKVGDCFIGRIDVAQDVLESNELFFENEQYQILNGREQFEPYEIEFITETEFEEILNSWIAKIKKMYGIESTI